MDLLALLQQYLKTMDQHNGPDSAEAKKFVEAHKDNVRFVRQAKTASLLWKLRH